MELEIIQNDNYTTFARLFPKNHDQNASGDNRGTGNVIQGNELKYN